jgi:hypothetical protein
MISSSPYKNNCVGNRIILEALTKCASQKLMSACGGIRKNNDVNKTKEKQLKIQ